MKCKNCGNEMQDTDLVCPFCKTPVEAESPVENESDDSRETSSEGAGEVSVSASADDSWQSGPSVPEEHPAVPEAPQKGSKGKIAAIAVAAAAVLGIGIFGATKLMEKDPKEVVIAAFENIYTEDQVKPMEELFGLSQFQEYYTGSSQQASMEFVLDDCSEEEVKKLAGGGIRTECRYDFENTKGTFNLGVLFNNMDLVNLNFYYGDQTLMAAIPELSSRVFTLDMSEGLAQRLKDSELLGPTLRYSDVDVEGLEDFYHEYTGMVKKMMEDGTATDPYGIKDVWKRYQEGSQAQENFKAALTVEKAEKGTFQMDGQEVTCKGYQVHISKDSMITFLRTSSDFFLQDQQLKERFLEYLKMSLRLVELTGSADSTDAFGGMSAEELLENNYEEVKKSVDEAIDQLDEVLGDVEMLVHVDKKGRLASVEGNTILTDEDGKTIGIQFDAKLQGGSYLTQNVLANVQVTGDDETVSLKMTKQGTYDGSRLTGDIAFDLDNGKDFQGNLFLGGTYDSDGGDFTLKAELGANGDKVMGLSAAGVVSELEKGTAIHMDFDELRIDMMPVNLFAVTTLEGLEDADEKFFITFDGEYDLRPLDGEVTEPKGEKLDILAATEADWQKVLMEAYMGVMDIASQVGSVMD